MDPRVKEWCANAIEDIWNTAQGRVDQVKDFRHVMHVPTEPEHCKDCVRVDDTGGDFPCLWCTWGQNLSEISWFEKRED